MSDPSPASRSVPEPDTRRDASAARLAAAPLEFDAFAAEYEAIHNRNIALSGEDSGFFAAYKVDDLAAIAATQGLAPERVGTVLDYGCGIGQSTPFLRRRFPAASILSVDVSAESLAVAGARHPGLSTRIAFDGDRLPLADETVDVALVACVLHHIDHADHVDVLAELRRVLRPGGVLVIYEHNPFNPLTRHAFSTCPFDRNARIITRRRLEWTVRRAGLGIATAGYRLFFPGPLRALRPLEAYLSWLPLGAQYVIAAR